MHKNMFVFVYILLIHACFFVICIQDTLTLIFAEIAMKRFHRGPKEWRLYSMDNIIYHKGPGPQHFEIKPLLNTKNSKQKNKKNNRKLQSIFTYRGERLYNALKTLFRTRGDISTDALFPQPLDNWVTDQDGNVHGFKDAPIGHNNLQMLYDNLLTHTLSFNNTYFGWNAAKTRKIKKSYYTLYGFRAACVTTAACGNMHDDSIICLSQHSSVKEIETYMRDCQQRQRVERAQHEFKSFVMNGMFIFIDICKLYYIH